MFHTIDKRRRAMKKEWDKAVKMLKEAAGTKVSCLVAEIWPTGMSSGCGYQNLRYRAYIDVAGHSDMCDSPVEAVKDIIEKMSEFV
jgi:hypothetical protein